LPAEVSLAMVTYVRAQAPFQAYVYDAVLDGSARPPVPSKRMGFRNVLCLLAALAAGCIFLIVPARAEPGGGANRVVLDERTFDPRDPAPGDFLDCPESRGPCQSVVLPRVMADEKVILPRNKPLESLRFLSLKGIRAQGGDPILSIALFATPKGDSVFADLNDDEDLGNDGPGGFWAKGDSCVTLDRAGGGGGPRRLSDPSREDRRGREKK
jgi:hypothetical protein